MRTGPIISEAKLRLDTGSPCKGKSGVRMLFKLLSDIREDDVYILNVHANPQPASIKTEQVGAEWSVICDGK